MFRAYCSILYRVLILLILLYLSKSHIADYVAANKAILEPHYERMPKDSSIVIAESGETCKETGIEPDIQNISFASSERSSVKSQEEINLNNIPGMDSARRYYVKSDMAIVSYDSAKDSPVEKEKSKSVRDLVTGVVCGIFSLMSCYVLFVEVKKVINKRKIF